MELEKLEALRELNNWLNEAPNAILNYCEAFPEASVADAFAYIQKDIDMLKKIAFAVKEKKNNGT